VQHRIDRIATTAHQYRQAQRLQINQMLILAEHLPETDRILMEQFLGQGHPVAHLARLFGVPVRQMHRRVNSITKRLSKKLFKDVSTQFDLLPREARPIARLVVFHGLSMRKAAKTSGMTLHQIRKHMNTVHATARLFQ
jgi:DNA-directed RNA polymerase specialized sigma24 family protein